MAHSARGREPALRFRVPVTVMSRGATVLAPAVVMAGFAAVGHTTLGIVPTAIVFACTFLMHRRIVHAARLLRGVKGRGRERAAVLADLQARLRELEHRDDSARSCVADVRDTTAEALLQIVQLHDPVTGAHLTRLCEYARVLVTEMARHPKQRLLLSGEVMQALPRASMLHDIGKVGVPAAILHKPGRLTAEEYGAMKRHTTLGGKILEALLRRDPTSMFLKVAYEIAQHHHERWDGTGYPSALRDEQIPLTARIVALADVYDALTSVRPYKRAYSHEATRGHLVAQARSHFDPEVVEAFLSREGDFQRIRAAHAEPALESEVLHQQRAAHLTLIASA